MTISFKKISKAELADKIGGLAANIKLLEDTLKAAKAEFKARGLITAAGSVYEAKLVTGNSVTLDKTAVVKKLGENWVRNHSRITEYQQVRTSVLTERYSRIYNMLKASGHSAFFALQILIDAKRKTGYALTWIKIIHRSHRYN